jgi:hypothetical protein
MTHIIGEEDPQPMIMWLGGLTFFVPRDFHQLPFHDGSLLDDPGWSLQCG